MSGKIKQLNYVLEDATFLVGNDEYFFCHELQIKYTLM